MHDTNGIIFQNPLTLELFLHCKNKGGAVGIRETQRALGIKSASSVHWHFNKLIDMGLLEQNPDNSFVLTEKGKGMRSLQVPINFPFRVLKGRAVNASVFQLAYLLFSLLFGLILLKLNTIALNIFFFLVVIVELGNTIRFFTLIQKASHTN